MELASSSRRLIIKREKNMFHNVMIPLAQVIVETEPDLEAVQDAAFMFNRPQFFAALIAGVVLAFAFQLLFTNLGVAAGISLAGGGSSSDSSSSYDDSSGGLGSTIKKVGMAVGLGTLFSVTLALFIASLLAVKLGLFVAPLSGAIVGLVIWATFFALMMLFSSKAIGSLLGSVANTATSGLQAILGTATAAIGADAASKQVVNTAEAAAAAVRRELGAAIDPVSMRENVEEFLESVKPAGIDVNKIARDFEQLLDDENLQEIVNSDSIRDIDRHTFVQLISDRDDIRLEVLATAEAAQAREKSIELMVEVEQYLTTVPKENLTPEKIQIEFKPILEDFDATYEQLSTRLAVLDRPTLERMLELRGDLDTIEASAIVGELELARDRVLEETQQNLGQAKAVAKRQWLKVQSYLRDTGKGELNPDGIERELEILFKDPQAGSSALRARLEQFDRDTLVQLLSQRQDLSEEQIEEAIDSVEGAWIRVTNAPQKLAGKAQEQYEQATSAIASYLRRTGKPELNPRGIQRDLSLLLEDPKLGSKAIRQRLAAMDRDTLVQLLAQRRDLSEEEVNQIIDDVQSTLRAIAKAPRRAAIRTQEKVQDFPSAIADYLRSTDKEELNPAGIKRDIELLLNDPRAGAESLKERLSKFDRDTLVALLTQRDDISEADVNRMVDEILAVRDNILAKLQLVQDRIKSAIERILAKIKAYLNSLDRPELAYEGIKQDINTLFDDPQAGFDALKDRFSQIDRDTLVAVMSSRDDISQADAERIIRQMERTRDRALQRAERIQTEAGIRLEETKKYAARQVEETRKAAATASWWLFFTGLISAIASAAAGALGVVG